MRSRRWIWCAVATALFALACGEHSPVDVTGRGVFPIQSFDVTGGIVFSARLAARGDTLAGALYLQNPTADSAYAEYGACSIGIRLYPTAERERAAYYNQLPSNAACIDVGYRKVIPPGGRDSVTGFVVQGTNVMPPVPPGHYWFSLVTVSSSGSKRYHSAGDADVP